MRTKKPKHSNDQINIYYEQEFQLEQDRLNNVDKKKIKEREKRIKQMNKEKSRVDEKFDFDTETVIGMTNKNHQAKRKEIQKQFDKQERIKQKRKRKIKRFLKWTSLICIIAGGTTFALVSPIFNIQEIEVTGNNIVTSETIESISEINKEQNIFKFFNKKVVENVKKNPYIETAKVKRKLPNKVQIQVEERERTFNIEFMNGYAYINNQGYILEISQEKLDLPVIQGAKTPEEKIVPGNRLEKEDLEKLETAITITKIWKNNEIEQKITSIDITDRLEYTMYVEEEKQKIYLGNDTNLNNKILWVQAIMKDNKGIEGEIYVNGDLNDKFKPRFKQKV